MKASLSGGSGVDHRRQRLVIGGAWNPSGLTQRKTGRPGSRDDGAMRYPKEPVMDDKQFERTQWLGAIGSLLVAALVVALSLPGAPQAEPAPAAAPAAALQR